MAKDTEKLIRQLSLISYLMAERRPVTALEIRRDVEGYSAMNEDAFARRFYADRSELESLGIQLTVDKPADGVAEQENYTLRPEHFYLPAIEFSDEELAALGTALSLLDGEFAYAEPLRLALQQISWGRPSPLRAPEQRSVGLGITAAAGGHELSHRLSKIETAIFRRKTITFDYYTMERDATEPRKVKPYLLLFRAGQFYLVGHAVERDAIRVFRLTRIRSKVAYATKAEHDFQRPESFDPREYADRIEWQFGDPVGSAEIWIAERVAWYVERHFGAYGSVAPAPDGDGLIFTTLYSNARQLLAWVLGLGEHARVISPTELIDDMQERVAQLVERHGPDFEPAPRRAPAAPDVSATASNGRGARNGKRDVATIRPERFARLVTLASILIAAGRADRRLSVEELRESLNVSEGELIEDVGVLNVVNFGGGSYVLYAELHPDGTIEVDPEPYSDNFARPARLAPVEAKALVAAIDLIGDHVPAGSLQSARGKIVAALGTDPAREGLQVAHGGGDDSEVAQVVSRAIEGRRLLELDYYKEHEDEFSQRVVEPYALINGREGWYLAAFDPSRESMRHFRLDRIKQATLSSTTFEPRAEVDPVAGLDGWPRTGELDTARRAVVWVSPERARWEREEREVVAELEDGAVLVERSFAGADWLVREVLKEAGDAVIIEPVDVRSLVRDAAERLGELVPVR